MSNNITININVGPEEMDTEPKIKVDKSHTKHGKKSVLKMPYSEPGEKSNKILDMLGA